MVLILLVLLLNGADTAPKPAKDRRFSFLRSVSVRLLLLDEPSQELRLSLTIFALLLKYRLRIERGCLSRYGLVVVAAQNTLLGLLVVLGRAAESENSR